MKKILIIKKILLLLIINGFNNIHYSYPEDNLKNEEEEKKKDQQQQKIYYFVYLVMVSVLVWIIKRQQTKTKEPQINKPNDNTPSTPITHQGHPSSKNLGNGNNNHGINLSNQNPSNEKLGNDKGRINLNQSNPSNENPSNQNQRNENLGNDKGRMNSNQQKPNKDYKYCHDLIKEIQQKKLFPKTIENIKKLLQELEKFETVEKDFLAIGGTRKYNLELIDLKEEIKKLLRNLKEENSSKSSTIYQQNLDDIQKKQNILIEDLKQFKLTLSKENLLKLNREYQEKLKEIQQQKNEVLEELKKLQALKNNYKTIIDLKPLFSMMQELEDNIKDNQESLMLKEKTLEKLTNNISNFDNFSYGDKTLLYQAYSIQEYVSQDIDRYFDGYSKVSITNIKNQILEQYLLLKVIPVLQKDFIESFSDQYIQSNDIFTTGPKTDTKDIFLEIIQKELKDFKFQDCITLKNSVISQFIECKNIGNVLDKYFAPEFENEIKTQEEQCLISFDKKKLQYNFPKANKIIMKGDIKDSLFSSNNLYDYVKNNDGKNITFTKATTNDEKQEIIKEFIKKFRSNYQQPECYDRIIIRDPVNNPSSSIRKCIDNYIKLINPIKEYMKTNFTSLKQELSNNLHGINKSIELTNGTKIPVYLKDRPCGLQCGTMPNLYCSTSFILKNGLVLDLSFVMDSNSFLFQEMDHNNLIIDDNNNGQIQIKGIWYNLNGNNEISIAKSIYFKTDKIQFTDYCRKNEIIFTINL